MVLLFVMIMIYVRIVWTKDSELNLAILIIKLLEDMPMVSSGIWGQNRPPPPP